MDSPLTYDIDMPRTSFNEAVNVVKAMRRGNYNLPDLRLVTQDSANLTVDQHMYVQEDPAALGVTFQDPEKQAFDVWLTPNISNWSATFALDTVLHELCHGFFDCYKHGDQFRRYLGRTLFHYQALVRYIDAYSLVTKMIARYSRSSDEHQAMEADAIYKGFLGEYEYVSRRYEELQNAEALVMSVA